MCKVGGGTFTYWYVSGQDILSSDSNGAIVNSELDWFKLVCSSWGSAWDRHISGFAGENTLEQSSLVTYITKT